MGRGGRRAGGRPRSAVRPLSGLRVDPKLGAELRASVRGVRRGFGRLAGLDPISALAAAMAVSLAGTIVYCLQLQSYFVMPDELGYVQQGTFIFAHGRPVLPGDAVFGSWSQLEPLLLALPYGLLSTPAAFDVAHVLNAVALVSTAWPSYVLARDATGSRGAGALVGALTVLVPWMTLAGTMLTESVAYPAFVWAILAAHRAILRPSLRADLLLLVAVGLAYAARTQLSLVAVAAGIGIVLHEVGWAWRSEGVRPPAAIGQGLRRAVTGHPLLVGAAALVVTVVASFSSHAVLGGYASPAQGDLLPPGTWTQARELLAQVSVGVGGLPLALGVAWILASFAAPGRRESHALAALALPAVVLITVALGSFSARFTAGVNDRYLFFLVPLLFVGTAAFLLDARRRLVPLAIGGTFAVWLIGSAELSQRGPSLVSPAAAFHDVLAVLGSVPAVAAIGTAVAVALVAGARILARPPGLQLAVAGIALLAFCATETASTMVKVARTQRAGDAFLAGRDWIDRAVPGRGRVVALLSGFPGEDRYGSAARWWDATFWNSDVRQVVRYADADDLNQKASTEMTVDPRTGALGGLDGDVRHLVVRDADPRLALKNAPVVRRQFDLRIAGLPRDPHAAWAWDGLTNDGRVALGHSPTLRVWSRARVASVTLDGTGAARTARFALAGRTIAVTPGARRTLRVPLRRSSVNGPGEFLLREVGRPAADPATELGPLVVRTVPR